MSENFHHLTNLPPLPEEIIQTGLTGNYFWTLNPNICDSSAAIFKETFFFKLLEKRFGRCNASFIKFLPFMYYDWHIDQQRTTSLNWVIQTNSKASTFYRNYYDGDPYSKELEENGRRPLFWKLEEVDYTLYRPTMLKTSVPHCVINNSPEERMVLSVTIHFAKYDELKDFLSHLMIDSY
jgi:hypothetical protein